MQISSVSAPTVFYSGKNKISEYSASAKFLSQPSHDEVLFRGVQKSSPSSSSVSDQDRVLIKEAYDSIWDSFYAEKKEFFDSMNFEKPDLIFSDLPDEKNAAYFKENNLVVLNNKFLTSSMSYLVSSPADSGVFLLDDDEKLDEYLSKNGYAKESLKNWEDNFTMSDLQNSSEPLVASLNTKDKLPKVKVLLAHELQHALQCHVLYSTEDIGAEAFIKKDLSDAPDILSRLELKRKLDNSYIAEHSGNKDKTFYSDDVFFDKYGVKLKISDLWHDLKDDKFENFESYQKRPSELDAQLAAYSAFMKDAEKQDMSDFKTLVINSLIKAELESDITAKLKAITE